MDLRVSALTTPVWLKERFLPLTLPESGADFETTTPRASLYFPGKLFPLPVAILGNRDSLDTRADGTVEFNEEH
jgi:hypothetical protein